MLLKKLNNRKGFTIIEVLISIIIIGTIVAIMIPLLSIVVGTQDSDSKPMNIISQDQENAVEEKVTAPPEPEEVNKEKGDMDKL